MNQPDQPTPSSRNNPPLKGIRVLDISRVLAGPWVGQTLADLGAEVIKIESPEGDETRGWGPPFVPRFDGEDVTPADAAYYYGCNRGKTVLVADFRDADDLAEVKKLAASADVLIENYRVGALVKFGLDYPSLAASNPRLIYCSISGFGQTGPYANRAGYDLIVQAMGGMMSLTGEASSQPQKMGVALADIMTGIYGVVAIEAALIERQSSGLGQAIDMALLDTMVSVLANQAQNYFATGKNPIRRGNAHPNIVPYQEFAVKDGYIVIAAANDRLFKTMCGALGVPELAEEERFATNQGRVTHRLDLLERLNLILGRLTRDEVLSALERVGVPAGPINTMQDVFSDPQIEARQMRHELTAPWLAKGSISSLRSPMLFSRSALVIDKAPPPLPSRDESKGKFNWAT